MFSVPLVLKPRFLLTNITNTELNQLKMVQGKDQVNAVWGNHKLVTYRISPFQLSFGKLYQHAFLRNHYKESHLPKHQVEFDNKHIIGDFDPGA